MLSNPSCCGRFEYYANWPEEDGDDARGFFPSGCGNFWDVDHGETTVLPSINYCPYCGRLLQPPVKGESPDAVK